MPTMRYDRVDYSLTVAVDIAVLSKIASLDANTNPATCRSDVLQSCTSTDDCIGDSTISNGNGTTIVYHHNKGVPNSPGNHITIMGIHCTMTQDATQCDPIPQFNGMSLPVGDILDVRTNSQVTHLPVSALSVDTNTGKLPLNNNAWADRTTNTMGLFPEFITDPDSDSFMSGVEMKSTTTNTPVDNEESNQQATHSTVAGWPSNQHVNNSLQNVSHLQILPVTQLPSLGIALQQTNNASESATGMNKRNPGVNTLLGEEGPNDVEHEGSTLGLTSNNCSTPNGQPGHRDNFNVILLPTGDPDSRHSPAFIGSTVARTHNEINNCHPMKNISNMQGAGSTTKKDPLLRCDSIYKYVGKQKYRSSCLGRIT